MSSTVAPAPSGGASSPGASDTPSRTLTPPLPCKVGTLQAMLARHATCLRGVAGNLRDNVSALVRGNEGRLPELRASQPAAGHTARASAAALHTAVPWLDLPEVLVVTAGQAVREADALARCALRVRGALGLGRESATSPLAPEERPLPCMARASTRELWAHLGALQPPHTRTCARNAAAGVLSVMRHAEELQTYTALVGSTLRQECRSRAQQKGQTEGAKATQEGDAGPPPTAPTTAAPCRHGTPAQAVRATARGLYGALWRTLAALGTMPAEEALLEQGGGARDVPQRLQGTPPDAARKRAPGPPWSKRQPLTGPRSACGGGKPRNGTKQRTSPGPMQRPHGGLRGLPADPPYVLAPPQTSWAGAQAARREPRRSLAAEQCGEATAAEAAHEAGMCTALTPPCTTLAMPSPPSRPTPTPSPSYLRLPPDAQVYRYDWEGGPPNDTPWEGGSPRHPWDMELSDAAWEREADRVGASCSHPRGPRNTAATAQRYGALPGPPLTPPPLGARLTRRQPVPSLYDAEGEDWGLLQYQRHWGKAEGGMPLASGVKQVRRRRRPSRVASASEGGLKHNPCAVCATGAPHMLEAADLVRISLCDVVEDTVVRACMNSMQQEGYLTPATVAQSVALAAQQGYAVTAMQLLLEYAACAGTAAGLTAWQHTFCSLRNAGRARAVRILAAGMRNAMLAMVYQNSMA